MRGCRSSSMTMTVGPDAFEDRAGLVQRVHALGDLLQPAVATSASASGSSQASHRLAPVGDFEHEVLGAVLVKWSTMTLGKHG